jgi:putative CocE/NonD family hydrolase
MPWRIVSMFRFFAALASLTLLMTVPAPGSDYDIRSHYTKFEFRIPMRDGVRLFTAVYVPKDNVNAYPILMERTPYSVGPYGADTYPETLYPGDAFVRDGFIFVYQDVRGRFMSEGTWREMTPQKDMKRSPKDVDESTDTYDTVEWLIKHVPKNNGKVGLLGISYPGFYAAAGAIDAHPALVAVSPQAPVSDLYMGDDAFHNGAFFLAANFGFYVGFPKQANPTQGKHEPAFDFGTEDGYEFYLKMGSVSNADEKYFRYTNPYWTDMISHPNYDDFWKERNLLPHLKGVKPATLVVGGWFDAEDLSGTLKTYRALEQDSGEHINTIVMGPWYHGGWSSSDGEKLGDIDFHSKTAEFFRNEIQLPFFKHYLKGSTDPRLPEAYMFETGRNEWRAYAQWPPQEAQAEKLYLRAGARLTFNAPEPNERFDEYVSDPNKPVPYFDKVVQNVPRPYMDADQRFAARRQDVLTYTTEPLEDDLTVAGRISPTLHVSTTGTDSDFDVKLIDVYPDDYPNPKPNPHEVELGGYQQLVRGEPFRGRFRKGFETPIAFTPGKVEKISFVMPDVDHCFRRGHRIMVQIQSSWFPLVDRNPQTFVNIAQAKQSDFVKATERVYHSSDAPSYLEMNIMPTLRASRNPRDVNAAVHGVDGRPAAADLN